MTAAKRPLVLVVDDHDAGRFAKAQVLARAGFEIAEASTGREALRVVAERHPDVVLLDINLPDMNGLEVCRKLKRLEAPSPPVQVLHMSSTSITDADRVRGLEGGADAYLTEPVNPDIVVATVDALLRVRRAETALIEAAGRERAAREDAERANHFKDEFLATLSHELRTPLNAMVGWIWQLRHNPGDEAIKHRALEGLERSTSIQVRLINDLLDVSRIDRGKLELELSRVDLSTVVRSAVDAADAAARAKQVTFEVKTVPVHVLGDSARLQQIVMNLLANAVQFSESGGTVEVSLELTTTDACVRVRDQGHGIERSLLPYIFDPFRQGEGGFARRHGGLGLGLAIVRQLVSLHKGTVTAESEGRHQGTTFTVRLPRDFTVAPVSGRADTDTGRLPGGTRVLVVDDDDDSRLWLTSIVEAAGGQADTASSAASAIDKLTRGTFTAIVSDIGMPDLDGIELVRELRRRGIRMPAVAVTAFASPAERARILASGYDLYFSKPLEPAVFIAGLTELVEGPPRSV